VITAYPTLGGVTLQNPVSLSSNPNPSSANYDRLYVVDGGTNQQVFGFDVNTHVNSRTLGVAGGMSDCNPNLTHTRFAFDSYPYNTTLDIGYITGRNYMNFASADDDDGLWIQDLAGARVQHFDGGGNYVNRIIAKRPNYYVMSSDTMPTRMFNQLLEYTINYNVPLVPGDPDPNLGGNGAWDQVRDWGICMFSPTLNTDGHWFVSVERLSNGRVYAQGTSHAGTMGRVIWELPDNTNPPTDTTHPYRARNTGVTMPSGLYKQVRNGDYNAALCQAGGCRGSSIAPGAVTYSKIPLGVNGTAPFFDSNNNPIYGTATNIITAATNNTNYAMISTAVGGELSTNGYFPYYYGQSTLSPTSYGTTMWSYPHFATLKAGFPSFASQSMPETYQYTSSFRAEFPSVPSTTFIEGGGTVYTEGSNFFFFYAGNNAINGSQIYHYFEDGMVVGQFGNVGGFPPGYFNGSFTVLSAPNQPTNFGNPQYWSVISMNNGADIYVYMSDETFAMAHRWHISNLGSIQEFAGSGLLQPNGSVTLSQITPALMGQPIRISKAEHRKEVREARR
jgi:hypothetical protein